MGESTQPPRPDRTGELPHQPPGGDGDGTDGDVAPEPGGSPRRPSRLLLVAGLAVVTLAAAAAVLLTGDDDPSTSTDADETASADTDVTDRDETGDDGDEGTGPAEEGEQDGDEETGTGEPTGPEGDGEGEGQDGSAPSGGGDSSAGGGDGGAGGDDFADSSELEFEGYEPGSPEAVTAAFFDAVERGDCSALIDLWSQSYSQLIGSTRQEQLQACEQTFQFENAPDDFDASSITVTSQDETSAVVGLTVTVEGATSDQEMYLVKESGWKIDLTGGSQEGR